MTVNLIPQPVAGRTHSPAPRTRARVRRPALVLVVAGGLALSVRAGAFAPIGAGAQHGTAAISAADYKPDRAECSMLERINNYRRHKGKKALALSPTLGAAADHHSEDMARHDYFSHNLKGDGISWRQNMRKYG